MNNEYTKPDGSLDCRGLLCAFLGVNPDKDDNEIRSRLATGESITKAQLVAASAMLDVILEPKIAALSTRLDRLIVDLRAWQIEIVRVLGISLPDSSLNTMGEAHENK